MTKKKKEILDKLELSVPEVDERIYKELGQEASDRQAEFYYESSIIPAIALRGPLKDASIFFNILIETLDPDYHFENEFESFKDAEDYLGGTICHAFKNIKVEHVGNEEEKEFLLEILSDLITHLDYARIKLYITDERAERKAGDVVLKRWMEYRDKKEQRENLRGGEK